MYLAMISSLEVKILPWVFVDGHIEFRIRVMRDGVEHSFVTPMTPDVMKSTWDQLWDRAKSELEHLIAEAKGKS